MRSTIPNGVGLTLRSPHVKQVAQGEAHGRVDFLELTPENYLRRGGRAVELLERVAERHPLTTHGVMLNLGGADPADEDYLRDLQAFLERFGAPWHSEHCSFCSVDGVRLHELFPVPMTRAWATHMADRMRAAEDRLKVRVIVENTCTYTEVGEIELREPEFMNEILHRSGCGLLLDVNNVYVNSKNHGVDAMDWLSRIDLEPVVEVHIGGHEPSQSMLVDTHGAPVIEEVYDLLSWALERIGPVPVLLERDANQPALSVMLDEADRVRAVYDQAIQRYEAGEAARRA